MRRLLSFGFALAVALRWSAAAADITTVYGDVDVGLGESPQSYPDDLYLADGAGIGLSVSGDLLVITGIAVCGDFAVEGSEDCDEGGVDTPTCDADCTAVVCGDGHENVAAGEDCTFCSADSVCSCGNLVCDPGEDCANCAGDCGVCPEALCGNSVIDPGENCDGGDCCSVDCQFLAAGAECRGVVGGCDARELCTGTSGSCPADGFAPAGTVCRTGVGVCDIAETCTGGSRDCPANQLAPAGTECRAAAHACDVRETCTGGSASCPGNAMAPNGTLCPGGTCSGGSCGLHCGNGRCETGETCSGCPTDCGACPPSVCGNGLCESGESCETCWDCGVWPFGGCPGEPAVCGDGVCQQGEDCSTCWDCGCPPFGGCGPCNGNVCGDGTCGSEESCETCFDCGVPPYGGCPGTTPPVCGDGNCDAGEHCSTCWDCGVPPYGGCPGEASFCGNALCEAGEDCHDCPGDCGACYGGCLGGSCGGEPACGNGSCEAGESCSACLDDCGGCVYDYDDALSTAILVGTEEITGGTSGYQLVHTIDPFLIAYVPARESDPYWWRYYRSFWDDDGTYVGNSLGFASETSFCTGDPHWGGTQTIGFGLNNGNTACMGPCEGQSYGYYSSYTCPDDGLYGGYYHYSSVSLDGSGTRPAEHHIRARISDGITTWFPHLSSLGYGYYVPDGTAITHSFRIQLNEWDTTTNQWREVRAGEVTYDGWGVVPAEPYVVDFSGGVQWVFIKPEGAEVMIYKQGVPGDPTACSTTDEYGTPILGATPCIVDPNLWLEEFPAVVALCEKIGCDPHDYCSGDCSAEDDRRAATQLRQMYQYGGKCLGFGPFCDPDWQKAGTLTIRWPDGRIEGATEFYAKSIMADNGGDVIIFINGSAKSEAAAQADALTTSVVTGKPVILIYYPQDANYFNEETYRDQVRDTIRDLRDYAGSAGYDNDVQWECHSHGCWFTQEELRQTNQDLRAINPGQFPVGAQTNTWLNALQNAQNNVDIVTGERDLLTQIGRGSPGAVVGCSYWNQSCGRANQDIYDLVQSRSNLNQYVVDAGHNFGKTRVALNTQFGM